MTIIGSYLWLADKQVKLETFLLVIQSIVNLRNIFAYQIFSSIMYRIYVENVVYWISMLGRLPFKSNTSRYVLDLRLVVIGVLKNSFKV